MPKRPRAWNGERGHRRRIDFLKNLDGPCTDREDLIGDETRVLAGNRQQNALLGSLAKNHSAVQARERRTL